MRPRSTDGQAGGHHKDRLGHHPRVDACRAVGSRSRALRRQAPGRGRLRAAGNRLWTQVARRRHRVGGYRIPYDAAGRSLVQRGGLAEGTRMGGAGSGDAQLAPAFRGQTAGANVRTHPAPPGHRVGEPIRPTGTAFFVMSVSSSSRCMRLGMAFRAWRIKRARARKVETACQLPYGIPRGPSTPHPDHPNRMIATSPSIAP